jgi:hypothetical protein
VHSDQLVPTYLFLPVKHQDTRPLRPKTEGNLLVGDSEKFARAVAQRLVVEEVK